MVSEIGINKDLKPLVRAVRRAGGTVELSGARSSHVRWTMPDGTEVRTGLTMSTARARNAHREITRALAAAALAPSRTAHTPAGADHKEGE